MLQENAVSHPTIDSPESKRFAAFVAGGWLAALVILPSGGLLWQTETAAHLGNWLVGNVLAELQLSGFFI